MWIFFEKKTTVGYHTCIQNHDVISKEFLEKSFMKKSCVNPSYGTRFITFAIPLAPFHSTHQQYF